MILVDRRAPVLTSRNATSTTHSSSDPLDCSSRRSHVIPRRSRLCSQTLDALFTIFLVMILRNSSFLMVIILPFTYTITIPGDSVKTKPVAQLRLHGTWRWYGKRSCWTSHVMACDRVQDGIYFLTCLFLPVLAAILRSQGNLGSTIRVQYSGQRNEKVSMEDHEWVEISLESFERSFLPRYLGEVDDSAVATVQRLAHVAPRSDAYPFLVCFPLRLPPIHPLIPTTGISIRGGPWAFVRSPRRESSYGGV